MKVKITSILNMDDRSVEGIEKDYTAAKLADMVDASHLLILTSQEQLVTKDTKEAIGTISVKDAAQLGQCHRISGAQSKALPWRACR